jgi:hypothetical protein
MGLGHRTRNALARVPPMIRQERIATAFFGLVQIASPEAIDTNYRRRAQNTNQNGVSTTHGHATGARRERSSVSRMVTASIEHSWTAG